MQKLLKIAAARGYEAEVFSHREKSIRLSKVNGVVGSVPASIYSGVSIRVIKDGQIGTAYTMNLSDREALLSKAALSMKAGIEAGFSFPESGFVNFTDEYDPLIEEMSFANLNRQLNVMESYYKEVKQGSLYVYGGCSTSEIRIVNTSGADLFHKNSEIYGTVFVVNPLAGYGMKNSAIGMSRIEAFPSDVERTVDFYNRSLSEVEIDNRRMKVLFTPDSMIALTYRLDEASSAKAFSQKISPLLNRTNELVISPLLSWVNDPTVSPSGRRLFDDEGVQTARMAIFEKGVFSNVFNNLDLACKLKTKPTGTSFREGQMGKKIEQCPSPYLSSIKFEPGDKSFKEILGMMDIGVIVSGVAGVHSGSTLNGDLSVRMTGLFVENGEVVGRLKNAMITANIYDILSNVVAVENIPHYSNSISKDPSMLFDDVQIVTL